MSPLYIGTANDTVKQVRPAGSRKVIHQDIDTTGVSSLVVTGIPNDAVRIIIAARSYSVDTGVYHRFSLQFGNDTQLNTNNVYWYTSGYYRSSGSNTHSRTLGSPTNYLSLIDTDHTGGSHVENGTVVCNRFSDSEGTSYAGWHVYATFGDMEGSGMQYTAQGFYGAANSNINRLKIFNSGAGYDSGARIGVSYETGDWD